MSEPLNASWQLRTALCLSDRVATMSEIQALLQQNDPTVPEALHIFRTIELQGNFSIFLTTLLTTYAFDKLSRLLPQLAEAAHDFPRYHQQLLAGVLYGRSFNSPRCAFQLPENSAFCAENLRLIQLLRDANCPSHNWWNYFTDPTLRRRLRKHKAFSASDFRAYNQERVEFQKAVRTTRDGSAVLFTSFEPSAFEEMAKLERSSASRFLIDACLRELSQSYEFKQPILEALFAEFRDLPADVVVERQMFEQSLLSWFTTAQFKYCVHRWPASIFRMLAEKTGTLLEKHLDALTRLFHEMLFIDGPNTTDTSVQTLGRTEAVEYLFALAPASFLRLCLPLLEDLKIVSSILSAKSPAACKLLFNMTAPEAAEHRATACARLTSAKIQVLQVLCGTTIPRAQWPEYASAVIIQRACSVDAKINEATLRSLFQKTDASRYPAL